MLGTWSLLLIAFWPGAMPGARHGDTGPLGNLLTTIGHLANHR